MDHGTPWWNMKAVAGWTWLTVWLMKQGIQLHFSGYRHPQTQGKVERFHGALGRAINSGRAMPARATSDSCGSMNFVMNTIMCDRTKPWDENARGGVEQNAFAIRRIPPLGNMKRGPTCARWLAKVN